MSSHDTRTGTVATADRAAVVAIKGAQSTPIPTIPGAGGASATATTRVATNVASATLLSANTARVGGSIFNNSTVNLFIKYGTTASITAGSESYRTRITPFGRHQIESGYTGRIDAISDAADATGEAVINEDT